MASPAISEEAALPSLEGAVDQWELWNRLDEWELRFFGICFGYLVCFLFLFGFLVEREDTALVPRVGVLNYVASPL
jgi:hypothetical protein